MKENEGYALLASFLVSPRCVMGPAMARELLYAAIDDPEFPSAGFTPSPSAVVKNVDILKYVLLDWRIYERGPTAVWEAHVAALAQLLNPVVTQEALVNARQFRRADARNQMLFLFQQEREAFPQPIALGLVQIFNFMFDSSDRSETEQLDDLGALMNYLVSTHEGKVVGTPEAARERAAEDTGGSSSQHTARNKANQKASMAEAEALEQRLKAIASTLKNKRFPWRNTLAAAAAAESTAGPAVEPVFGARLTHSRSPKPPPQDWRAQSVRGAAKDARGTPAQSDDITSTSWRSCAESHSGPLISVRVGILRLLIRLVIRLPNKLFGKLPDPVSIKVVLALADHKDPCTRALVVRLIDILLRVHPGFGDKFGAAAGPLVLKTHLGKHRITEEIFIACCDIYTGQTPYVVPEDASSSRFDTTADQRPGGRPSAAVMDGLSEPPASDYIVLRLDTKISDRGVYRGQTCTATVLVGLLEGVAGCELSELTHMIRVLSDIFARREDLQQPLIDSGLVSVVTGICNTMAADGYFDLGRSDVSIWPRLLLAYSEALLTAIVGHACELFSTDALCKRGIRLIQNAVDGLGRWGSRTNVLYQVQQDLISSAVVQAISHMKKSPSTVFSLFSKKPQQMLCFQASGELSVLGVDLISYYHAERAADADFLHFVPPNVGVVDRNQTNPQALEADSTAPTQTQTQAQKQAPPCSESPICDVEESGTDPTHSRHNGVFDGGGGAIGSQPGTSRAMAMSGDDLAFVREIFTLISRTALSIASVIRGNPLPNNLKQLVQHLGRLCICILLPSQPAPVFTRSLLFVTDEFSNSPELVRLVGNDTEITVHLHSSFMAARTRLAAVALGEMTSSDAEVVDRRLSSVMATLANLQPVIRAPRSEGSGKNLGDEVEWVASVNEVRNATLIRRVAAPGIGSPMDGGVVGEEFGGGQLIAVTSALLEAQNQLMFSTLNQVKANVEASSRIKTRWQALSDAAAQPRAVWSKPDVDAVWLLDPTEGPLRMRKRLTKTRIPGRTKGKRRLVSTPLNSELDDNTYPSPPAREDPHFLSSLDSSDRVCEGEGSTGFFPAETDATIAKLEKMVAEVLVARKHPPISTLRPAAAWSLANAVLDELRDTECSASRIAHNDGAASIPSAAELAHLRKCGLFSGLAPPESLKGNRTDKKKGGEMQVDDTCKSEVSGITMGRSSSATAYLVNGDRLNDGDSGQEEDSGGIGGGLQPGERLFEIFQCQIVSPFTIKAGELLIGQTALYFKEDPARSQNVAGQSRPQPASIATLGAISSDPAQLPYWPTTIIQEVHKRRYLLQGNSLEIFLTNGTTLFVAFESTSKRRDALAAIHRLNLPSYVDYSQSVNGSMTRDSITAQWIKGAISNFDYLMHLNKLAGRSFNDLTQYPVMPFVLKDYQSDVLDLENPATFRDLSKPMGAQTPERLAKFEAKFRDLRELGEEPYYYGSHYSSVGSVLHFLLRLEPYTQLFLELQGGRFDFADRTFHDIGQTWLLSSQISTSDVKELIPEFFFLPEFLNNQNGCDFGHKQNGESVSEVRLPPWAHGDARRFIQLHRRALESDFVSAQLHTWIDLVFGSKQIGEAAKQAKNLFLPLSYENPMVDIDSVVDPVEREAKWAIVRSFGQTPRKLLKFDHKPREARVSGRVIEFLREPGVHWHGTWPRPTVGENTSSWSGYIVDFADGDVLVLDSGVTILPRHSREDRYCLVWGGWDDSLRVFSFDGRREMSVIQPLHDDRITCAAAAGGVLVTGGNSGVVSVYRSPREWKSTGSPSHGPPVVAVLPGHLGAVGAVLVSSAFRLILSGSNDGTVIMWDLNRREYIRTLGPHEGRVVAMALSDGTGDIVTVCSLTASTVSGTSRLRLWTVNGSVIAIVDTDAAIISVTMSSFTDGVIPNIVVGGTATGCVIIWDAFDMVHQRTLYDPRFASPVVSISLDLSGKSLTVAHADGKIVRWSSTTTRLRKMPFLVGVGGVHVPTHYCTGQGIQGEGSFV